MSVNKMGKVERVFTTTIRVADLVETLSLAELVIGVDENGQHSF